MHRSDLADNDAIRWSGHPSAEKSARENVTGVKKLHGEDKLLPCCSAAGPPVPSLNHFMSLPPRREREREEEVAP
jgi:hypothetical protein